MKNLPAQIFREYDIRGIAERELTSDVSRGIGAAFATVLAREGKTRIAVGYDLRPSSDRIQKALVDGLTSAGAWVINFVGIAAILLSISGVWIVVRTNKQRRQARR